ncbi:MAG: hypothetical protein QNJ51_18925 [Calothrix sp. MO_167.B12]|nr:hypothetical protein [Calothrix sp. MO_167.B12]
MNTHTHDFPSCPLPNNSSFRGQDEHSIQTIILLVLGSFLLASIPIVYGFTLTPTPQATTVPHEATLWY